MSIIRVIKKDNPYVTIDKTCLNDGRLSWKAKGLHSYLLSLPDDWKIFVKDLIKRSRDGRDSIYGAFKELEQHGYLRREHTRSEKGQASGVRYDIFECPQETIPENCAEEVLPEFVANTRNKPLTENPEAVDPEAANQPLINNKQNKIIKDNNRGLVSKNIKAVEGEVSKKERSYSDINFSFSDISEISLSNKQLSYTKGALNRTIDRHSLKVSNPSELFSQLVFSLESPAQRQGTVDFKHALNRALKIIADGNWRTPHGFKNHAKPASNPEMINEKSQFSKQPVPKLEHQLDDSIEEKKQKLKELIAFSQKHPSMQSLKDLVEKQAHELKQLLLNQKQKLSIN